MSHPPWSTGQRDQLAAHIGAGRPAGVGQQHQGEQARHLAVFRPRPVDRSGQPHRLRGQVRAARSPPGGRWNSAPVARIRCLARLIRWAMVASGTTEARATSAVVRPPTARRVSATYDGGDSSR